MRPISHKTIRYLVGSGPHSLVSLAVVGLILILIRYVIPLSGWTDGTWKNNRQTHMKLSCRQGRPVSTLSTESPDLPNFL